MNTDDFKRARIAALTGVELIEGETTGAMATRARRLAELYRAAAEQKSRDADAIEIALYKLEV